jgi:RNA polymerase sigma factor (sigma-70 family)
MITHKQLFEWSLKSFQSLRLKKYSRYKFPSQEWEDFRSKASIRVIQQFNKYEKTRGKPYSFVYTIVDNSIKNSIRDLLGDPRSKTTKWKRKMLIMTDPFVTKSVQIDRFGNEEITYTPDMIDESGTKDNFFELSQDDIISNFSKKLSEVQRKTLLCLIDGKTPKQISKEKKMKLVTVYQQRSKIKKIFKELLYKMPK